MPGRSVRVFVCAYSFVYDREGERETGERGQSFSLGGVILYMC